MATAEIKRVLDMIGGGYFSGGDPSLFRPIFESLLHAGDHYLLLADYASYIHCQERVSRDVPRRARMDAAVDFERRADGKVLERPVDPAVRRRDLGCEAGDRPRSRGEPHRDESV